MKRPWERHSMESQRHYEMLQSYLTLPINDRRLDIIADKHSLALSTTKEISAKMKWLYRTAKYDDEIFKKSFSKAMTSNIDYLTRAQTATQKIVATLAEKVVAALEEDDDDKIKKAIEKLKPFTALLSGYGKLGEFLLQAHETFHGTKQTVDATLKGELLQWGTPIMKQVVDTTIVPEQLTYANPTTTAQ